MSYIKGMNTRELIRKVRKAGRKSGVEVRFDQSRGKGSHGTLYYGARRATVPYRTGDIQPGTVKAILTQLGLTENDI